MKRSILALLVVGIVLFGACSAQNANAQNVNIAQKIVGTWVPGDRGETWVFSANGTFKVSNLAEEYKYVVTDTKIFIKDKSGNYNSTPAGIYDISISSDGKTLILSYPGRDGYQGYWLTKK